MARKTVTRTICLPISLSQRIEKRVAQTDGAKFSTLCAALLERGLAAVPSVNKPASVQPDNVPWWRFYVKKKNKYYY